MTLLSALLGMDREVEQIASLISDTPKFSLKAKKRNKKINSISYCVTRYAIGN